MGRITFLLFLACLVALIVGIKKPDIVIRWGNEEKRNRKKVITYYGIGTIVFLFIFSLNSNNWDIAKEKINKEVTIIQETVEKDK